MNKILPSAKGFDFLPQSSVIDFHHCPDSTSDFCVETCQEGTYNIVTYVGILNRDHLFTSHEPRLFQNDFVPQLI